MKTPAEGSFLFPANFVNFFMDRFGRRAYTLTQLMGINTLFSKCFAQRFPETLLAYSDYRPSFRFREPQDNFKRYDQQKPPA